MHGITEGQAWVSGGINWAKEGRHFKLETCPKHEDEADCFIWKEMDPSHWYYLFWLTFPKSIFSYILKYLCKVDCLCSAGLSN